MLAAGLLALAAAAGATPVQQQVVFGALDSTFKFAGLPKIPHHGPFNPLDHMSGIAPYHDAPHADIQPPPQCRVAAAAFLIRHSSIYANDDEFEDYMQPFIERVERAQRRGVSVQSSSPLSFLAYWTSRVNDSVLEEITDPGKEDAYEFGKRFRELYGPLMPPKHLGRGEGKKGGKGKKGKKHAGKKGEVGDEGKVKTPFKVWSASSDRDVETSKAWVRGAFPHWQEGKEGEGDGRFVQLVAVKNKDPSWSDSLTPHKICDTFTKEAGKPEAQQWLDTYGPPVLERLNKYAPGFDFELNDVIAMQMMCGYETVITKDRSSPFCSGELFKPDEFRAFGYWNDLKYHHMVGYGSPVAPYLGVHWLNTSTHNLLAAYAPDPHPKTLYPPASSLFSRAAALFTKPSKLPPPSAPPDATHTQLLYVYFTHREEPPIALTALGIWNTTTESLPPTSMPKDRQWKTSHLLPFLGHVAIERLHCEPEELAPSSSRGWFNAGPAPTHPRKDYVRILVNGAPQELPACHDGPGGTCLLADFEKFVQGRVEEFKDFEGACKKDDGGGDE